MSYLHYSGETEAETNPPPSAAGWSVCRSMKAQIVRNDKRVADSARISKWISPHRFTDSKLVIDSSLYGLGSQASSSSEFTSGNINLY
jgi:hypothetical protein